jgi:hypothetical protein
MHRNPFWILFLSLLVLGIGGFSVRTGCHLWHYLRLDKQIPAQNIQWSVVSLSDEEFVPFARYYFNVKGISYQGQTLWQETYLNAWTAQETIARLSASPPLVWFYAPNPEISSLQKHFPLKESLYTLLLWFLGLYFLGLGYYVKLRFPN